MGGPKPGEQLRCTERSSVQTVSTQLLYTFRRQCTYTGESVAVYIHQTTHTHGKSSRSRQDRGVCTYTGIYEVETEERGQSVLTAKTASVATPHISSVRQVTRHPKHGKLHAPEREENTRSLVSPTKETRAYTGAVMNLPFSRTASFPCRFFQRREWLLSLVKNFTTSVARNHRSTTKFSVVVFLASRQNSNSLVCTYAFTGLRLLVLLCNKIFCVTRHGSLTLGLTVSTKSIISV